MIKIFRCLGRSFFLMRLHLSSLNTFGGIEIMPEWAVGLLVATIFYLLGLSTKNFLPSYMDEKGKNLATKEDI